MCMNSKQRKGSSHSEAGRLGALASKKTVEKQVQKRVLKYNLSPELCNYCKSSLPYSSKNNKFCSSSCSAKFNNPRKTKKPRKLCIECFSPLHRGKKYCSFSCQQALAWSKRKEKIMSGCSTMPSKQYKRYILEVRGHQCEICKNKKWMDKSIPIEMDHINGNYKDNSLDNLRLVCCNCHAQTPTYKSKNKGNGRAKRRQRYAEGKSY